VGAGRVADREPARAPAPQQLGAARRGGAQRPEQTCHCAAGAGRDRSRPRQKGSPPVGCACAQRACMNGVGEQGDDQRPTRDPRGIPPAVLGRLHDRPGVRGLGVGHAPRDADQAVIDLLPHPGQPGEGPPPAGGVHDEVGAYPPDVAVVQTSVNVADQSNIDRVLPAARKHNAGVMAKRPIANAAWKEISEQPGMYQSYAATHE